ncbi:SMI1/KNR4 family protein [Blastopirellula marina]|uniref:Knr4/Smi1-like domain-containing protein n=1 Tax=Blastopirellula marina DSM 3645 TaxID=314230 RepID=A3ZWD8_9BACT|nr:SMI1/KNR4 family protein [Blastopirellula marina]EAQ79166.1 hypothetical protein DSM3645_26124 [Blastopirellula marina DSM 3645]
MSITDLIELMKREGTRLAEPVPIAGMPAMEFSCLFTDEAVTQEELSVILPVCHQDIARFWMHARNAHLFHDQTYGQWGLEILDPLRVANTTAQFYERRKRDFVSGDIIVGKFFGDSDVLVIRNNPEIDDFGYVYVALPIDPRSEWHLAAKSFEEFLNLFVKSGGDKYWAK